MKLVLRTEKTDGEHPLYVRLKIGGSAYWCNLLMTVDAAEWNEVSKSERKQKNYLNKKGISKKIALIEDAITDMRRHHRLTKDNLDEVIENVVLADKREGLKRAEALKKDIEYNKKTNIKNFVIEHVHGIENGTIRTSTKGKYAKESIKNWQQFRRVFLDFYKIMPFEWDNINEALADRYISYLESLGYMKYTLDKHISLFKTLIGAAERQGLHTNHIACSLLRSPKITEDDKAKKIYLTKEELSALYEMPLNGFQEQVRDVFLIGCFTGMRFSDYSRIKKANIGFTHNGTKVIRLKQEKTAKVVVVPIMDDRLEVLLKKYDYNVPKIWDQNLNRTIKEICKNLSESVPSLQKKERTILTLKEKRAESNAQKKGKVLYEYDEQGYPLKPRWELVASHTARRSCITNMYLSKKFTIPQMMSVSGHKTEAMFFKYVKLSLDEYAESVASAAVDGLF
ncbi:MAG: tyrosine-type recombinase/integrase [Bacteroidales bacterium]|nr:tyrosine-type recombinase/integrase [Bacteroidales bacterium]